MDLFFGTDLPKKVTDCLSNTTEESLEDLKLWGKTREECVEHIQESVRDGLIYLVYQDDICLLFMDKTPYTIYLNMILTKESKQNKVVRILKETFTMFQEKTDVHKVELSTTCPELHPILMKCGFSQEGTFTDSRRIPSGEFVDEFYYGYLIDV